MRRFCSVFIVLSCVIATSAGEYTPKTLKVGRRWEMMSLYFGNGEHPDTVYHALTIDKQMEVGGKSVYRAYDKHWSYGFYYFYEEDGRVYSCDENMNSRTLQLDYNLGVGEYSKGDRVVKADYIRLNGELLRRISFNAYSIDRQQVRWVEGVGSSYAALLSHYGTVAGPFMGSWVLSVWDGDNCIFTRYDFHQSGEELPSADYRPLLKEGKRWSYEMDRGSVMTFELYLDGDTIIGDKECIKLYRQQGEATTYQGAFFEEGQQVYFVDGGKDSPVLYYDFGLREGDVFDLVGMKVLYSHHMAISGEERRVTYLSSADNQMKGAWVEGIGSVSRLDTPVIMTGNDAELVSCVEDGKEIFTREDYRHLLATIASGISEQNVNPKTDKHASYDLQGRRLTSNPQKGLYIRDGKKYVVKE